MKNPLVLGIDIGTEGVRVVIVDATGCVMEDVYQEISHVDIPGLPLGYLEQNPQDWWDAVVLCLRQALSGLHKHGYAPDEIVAVAVDSKSGIIVLLDEENQPLHPALMHDDRRAQAEAEEVNIKGAALCKKLGYRFDASFSSPRFCGWPATSRTPGKRPAALPMRLITSLANSPTNSVQPIRTTRLRSVSI